MAPVNRKLWNKEKIIHAVRSVQADQMEYKRAAKQFSVPKGTLERYVKDNTKSLEELVQVNLGRRPILPNHTESELAKYCIEIFARFYGLRRNDVKRMASQLAIRNGIQHPFSLQRKSAGRKKVSGIFEAKFSTDSENTTRYFSCSSKRI
jgi:hypothetical protein